MRIDAEAADVELLPVFVGREVHELAAGVRADADDEVGGGEFVGEVETFGVVELVRAVDGEGVSAAEDAMGEKADGGGLGSEMYVEVGLAVASHPLADHHGLRKVHEVEEETREVEATKAEDEGESAEVAGGGLEEGFGVGEEGAGDAVALDAVGAVGFFAFLGGEAVGGTIGRVDGGGFNAKAQRAKKDDLAQDKDHGKRGVAADQIGDGAGRGRGGCAEGGDCGMEGDRHGAVF